MSEQRRGPTLRGRVSALGVIVIAGWLVVLVVAFDLVLDSQLRKDADDTLRTRAEAVAATLVPDAGGRVRILDPSSDSDLDSGVWIFADGRALERPRAAPPHLQAAALRVAALPGTFANDGDGTRLYSMPVTLHGRRVATVVTSASLAAYSHATRTAIIGTALVAALVLVIAYLVLRLVAARALRPVENMTQQAATWASQAGAERFGQQQRYRELNALAQNLDAVLDRLGAVLRHEQQLSAELSHELRTPLSRISSETDLLLSQRQGSGADRDAYLAIRTSAENMSEILETLLSTARLDTGRLPGTCDLSRVLRSSSLPQGTAVSVDADAAEAGVDDAVATRLLAPILDNAHRYAHSQVNVTTSRIDGGIAIDVQDDGPGIPADLRERVFEPGFRAEPSDGHDGAGLGLPLARRLARAAEGDVVVLPSASGARVRVLLPPG